MSMLKRSSRQAGEVAVEDAPPQDEAVETSADEAVTEDSTDAAGTADAAEPAESIETAETAEGAEADDATAPESAAAAKVDKDEIKAMKARVKAAKAEMKAAKKAASRPADAVSRSAGGPSRVTLIAMALVAVVLAIPAVLLTLKVHEADQTAKASEQAAHSAAQVVQDVSTFDYRTLDADTKTALRGITGKLRTDYEKLAQQVRPIALQQQAVATTTVIKAGTESASAKRVTVIVFANRSTVKSGQTEAPLPESLRVRITMVKVGDRWLASEMSVL